MEPGEYQLTDNTPVVQLAALMAHDVSVAQPAKLIDTELHTDLLGGAGDGERLAIIITQDTPSRIEDVISWVMHTADIHMETTVSELYGIWKAEDQAVLVAHIDGQAVLAGFGRTAGSLVKLAGYWNDPDLRQGVPWDIVAERHFI